MQFLLRIFGKCRVDKVRFQVIEDLFLFASVKLLGVGYVCP